MSDAGVALLVLAVVLALFLWNRLPVGIVALGAALALWATGLLPLDQALGGFGDPVIAFIASLFVVSEAIDRAGVAAWAGARLLEVAGTSRTRLTVAVMLLCAFVTGLISINGSVAALLPMVVVLAVRCGIPPSALLMPMVFAGSAGSLLVLTGSPVNVVASDLSAHAGAGPFGFLEFAWVGVPILFGTVLIAALLGPRVLPERRARHTPADLSRHAETLASHYGLLDSLYHLRLGPGSPLVGSTAAAVDTGDHPVVLVGIQDESGRALTGSDRLGVGDALVVSGPRAEVERMASARALSTSVTPLTGAQPEQLVTSDHGVVEVVVPPRSPLVETSMFPGMVRRENLVILAIQHRGHDSGPRPVDVQAGDALLVYGAWDAIGRLTEDRDVLVVDSPDAIRRQAAPLGRTAVRAVVILTAMVLVLALGLVPPAVAGLLAAGGMVLSGVLSSAQAYRAVSWELIVLIGGLLPMSAAMTSSGAADLLAERITGAVGDSHPLVLVLVLFALTAVMGLVISNTATVLIVAPIGLSVGAEAGLGVQPVIMVVAIAASAALLTPVQTPANLMVMAPAGYRFGDYWKLGLPTLAWWLVVCLVVVPLVWPL
jgi:di/tricarboxylate transporter